MTDVIEFLYESQCNEEPESIPELAELYETESEIFDKIHAALGLKALDHCSRPAKLRPIPDKPHFGAGLLPQRLPPRRGIDLRT